MLFMFVRGIVNTIIIFILIIFIININNICYFIKTTF